MSLERAKIRLFVEQDLAPLQSLPLGGEQAHYLFNVMRLGIGDRVALFNGRDGEWTARILEAGKKKGRIELIEQTSAQQDPPDLWLLFAPIKKARTDFIVEKAAELGAARIIPISTDFTNTERVRQDRLQAHAIEAAEQCGGTFVPDVLELKKLRNVLSNWNPDRQLFFCDESLSGNNRIFDTTASTGPAAILIGPEGGFSAAEREELRQKPYTRPMTLGPRILRADTAAVAALSLWQEHFGDWR